VAALSLALGACGGGSEVLVVPLFLFGFTDATNQVSMFFSPDQPTTPTGSFTSVNVQFGPDQASLPADVVVTGTWSGCTLTLRLTGAPAAPIANGYRGQFTSRDTIQLTPDPAQAGRPVLTLQRGGSSNSAPNCP
jgi:hypothetical protein